MKDFSFCKELVLKDNYKICLINHYYFHKTSKEDIDRQSILYGLKCSKKKSKGRVKGSINKQSDYDPYKEKILEGLEKKCYLAVFLFILDLELKADWNTISSIDCNNKILSNIIANKFNLYFFSCFCQFVI